MPDDLASTLAGIRDDNIDSYADGSTSDIPRLLAAIEAALKLADDWEADSLIVDPEIAIRAAITAALAGKDGNHG